jgi:hypothetical protein
MQVRVIRMQFPMSAPQFEREVVLPPGHGQLLPHTDDEDERERREWADQSLENLRRWFDENAW